MPERENRREKILQAASALFMERGYRATSVRQIAEAVGCTEAALYYHFKAGKRELLQHVIGLAEVDLRETIEHLQAAVSLPDLIERYGYQLHLIGGGRVQQTLRWISAEIRNMSAEERETFYRPLRAFHQEVCGVVKRYISDPAKADDMAWLIICTGFGYRQVFFDLEFGTQVEVDVRHLYDLLVQTMTLNTP